MIRALRPRLVALAGGGGAILLAATILLSGGPRPAGSPHGGPAAPGDGVAGGGVAAPADVPGSAMTVRDAVKHDLSQPLRSMRPELTPGLEDPDMEEPRAIAGRAGRPGPSAADPVLQPAGTVAATSVSAPVQNFEGVSNRNGVLPPDTNGDVGPNHYVQWVNLSLAIYSKTGALLYGPTNGNTIWSGFGGPCQTLNNGDPIVLYDPLADRWMISQFALPGGVNGYHQCIAVSQTADPTGAWYRYDFLYSATKMNDYPHFGVWPDGYYMSVNQFTGGVSWGGQGVAVFERSQMLLGQPARMVSFDLYGTDPNLGGMLPSDFDGATPPPSGASNPFAEMDDNAWGYSPDQLQLWNFHVDWTTTANSTFTKTVALPTAAFDSNLCGGSRNCIPQAGTTVKLDSLADRLMYRLQYRNFGDHQSIVVNHTVDVDGADHAGIRWYELQNTGSGWSIFQQGTFAPDANQRWMGSAAMNGAGGIAIGYSISSASTYASIRYTGRVAADPLGTLPQGEGTIINGTGAQTHSASRWGDYSMLAVDPVDDCTFWYTSEYVKTTGSAPWQTRIASFTLPGCGGAPPPAPGTITGLVTDSSTSLAVSGATVAIVGGASTTTDAAGAYTLSNVAAGTYSVTASKAGYTSSTNAGVSVASGSTTTSNFALAPVPPVTTTDWTFGSSATPVLLGAGDNNGYEAGSANLLAFDGAVATDANSGSSSSQSCTSTARDKEHIAGFSFGVPSAAAIQGIAVQLRGSISSAKNAPKFCVLLSRDGGTTWTAGKATGNLTTSLVTYTLGSSSDTWGLTWTGADVVPGKFVVRIVDLANSTARTFSLDGVRVQLTYQ